MATDFVGSVPSSGWLAAAEADLEGGVVSLVEFAESLLALPGATGVTAPTDRAVPGVLLRIPDHVGLDYWIRKVRSGTSLDTAASQFAAGSEFVRRYGDLDNPEYVTQLYRNLFARGPDPSGIDYWVRRLDGGAKRGWVMRQMCESDEYRRKTASQVRVIQVYIAMLRRAPDSSGYTYWSTKDGASPTGLQQLTLELRDTLRVCRRRARPATRADLGAVHPLPNDSTPTPSSLATRGITLWLSPVSRRIS